MKLLASSLIWLAASNVVQAFTWSVPPDIEDGIYTVGFHEDDTNMTSPLIHRRGDIEHHAELERQGGNTLAARHLPLPISRKGCIKGFPKLDADDYYASKVALNNWCSRGNTAFRVYATLARKGTVLVWMCSFGWFGYESPCSTDELDAAEGVWNATCGHDTGAFVAMKKWAKTYGRSHKDLNKVECRNFQ